MASSGKYQRMTYSMDPRDPNAIKISAQFESMIRQSIQQLQKKGAPVFQSDRYKEGGSINSDYYVPAKYMSQIQTIFNEEIAKLGNLGSGLGFSSASDSSSSLHTMQILDQRARAEIAALVKRNRGVFSTDKNGTSTWMIDNGIAIPGTGKSVASSISSRASNANTRYKHELEQLLSRNVGGPVSYDDFSPSEIDTIIKHDKAIKNEKQFTYDRLAKRGRLAGYEKQYAIDNPDDPYIKERADDAKKGSVMKAAGNAVNAGKFVLSSILGGIGLVVGALGTSIGLLSKIGDTVGDMRDVVKERNQSAAAYGFDAITQNRLEILAQNKHLPANTFGSAIGSLVSDWGDPTFYDISNFSKVAPLLRTTTGELTDMSRAGGQENAIKMFTTLTDDIYDSIKAGRTPSGKIVSEASARSIDMAAIDRGFKPAVAAAMKQVLYDRLNNGFTGNTDAYLNQSVIGLGNTTSTIQKGTEQTGDEWFDFLTSIKTFIANAAGLFSAITNLSQVIEDLRHFLVGMLNKIFPGSGAEYYASARSTNESISPMVNKATSMISPLANAAMKKYGLTGTAGGIIKALGTYDGTTTSPGLKGLTLSQYMQLMSDPDALLSLAGLAYAQDASRFLKAQASSLTPEPSKFSVEHFGAGATGNATAVRYQMLANMRDLKLRTVSDIVAKGKNYLSRDDAFQAFMRGDIYDVEALKTLVEAENNSGMKAYLKDPDNPQNQPAWAGSAEAIVYAYAAAGKSPKEYAHQLAVALTRFNGDPKKTAAFINNLRGIMGADNTLDPNENAGVAESIRQSLISGSDVLAKDAVSGIPIPKIFGGSLYQGSPSVSNLIHLQLNINGATKDVGIIDLTPGAKQTLTWTDYQNRNNIDLYATSAEVQPGQKK